MPKPFSVKLRPTRVLRPRPSNSRQMIFEVSTPPCIMRSSTSQPRSLLRQRGDGGGAFAPAFAHGARDVVFAAAFPHLEAARIAHAAEAGIEAQHHFAERGAVPARLARRTGSSDTLSVMLLYFPRMVLMSFTVSRTRSSMPS